MLIVIENSTIVVVWGGGIYFSIFVKTMKFAIIKQSKIESEEKRISKELSKNKTKLGFHRCNCLFISLWPFTLF